MNPLLLHECMTIEQSGSIHQLDPARVRFEDVLEWRMVNLTALWGLGGLGSTLL